MNKALRIYFFLGLCYLAGSNLEAIRLWISSTQNGLLAGSYDVIVYTNGLGENYYELGLFIVFLPAVGWVFVKPVRNLLVGQSRTGQP